MSQIWMNEMKQTGGNSPLAAHYHWNKRVQKETHEQFRSAFDVGAVEQKKVEYLLRNPSNVLFSGFDIPDTNINVSSTKNFETKRI